jgi:pilus assembly protein CpaB
MGRRTLLLIASILVAALGTALIWLYVQGADTRAVASETQVPVYVATRNVAVGQPLDRSVAVVKQLPQSLVSPLSSELVSSTSQLQGYAKTDITAGLPLLTTQISTAQTAPAPAVALDPNKIALQMSLSDPQRLAGLLQPGSLIRIYIAEKSGSSAPQATILLPVVKVLASGPVAQASGTAGTAGTPGTAGTAQAPNGQVPQANVVLEVTDDQAMTLIARQTEGSGSTNSMWFGLLGSKLASESLKNAAG